MVVDFYKKMKEEFFSYLSSFFKNVWIFIKTNLAKFYEIVNISYKRCRDGEEKLNNLLIYWSIIPCILYFLLIYKFGLCKFMQRLCDLIMIFIGFLDIFFIQKALKKHPEYNTKLVMEYEKEQYYSSLSKEELEQVKSDEKKQNTKDFFKRMLLIKPGEKVDFYKIVRLFVILTVLVGLKRVLL